MTFNITFATLCQIERVPDRKRYYMFGEHHYGVQSGASFDVNLKKNYYSFPDYLYFPPLLIDLTILTVYLFNTNY